MRSALRLLIGTVIVLGGIGWAALYWVNWQLSGDAEISRGGQALQSVHQIVGKRWNTDFDVTDGLRAVVHDWKSEALQRALEGENFVCRYEGEKTICGRGIGGACISGFVISFDTFASESSLRPLARRYSTNKCS